MTGLRQRADRSRGFTLIDLLLVVALIAMASGLVALSLRDPSATQLEREAARLASLLEAARAEARASGLTVRWEPKAAVNLLGSDPAEALDFRFIGLPASSDLPQRWLVRGIAADVPGARAIVLGPEPLIGEQRIVLSLNDQRLTLATDGLGPFAVETTADAPAAR